MRQDDPATAFFIVIDGWVKIYRSTLSGDETVIADRYDVALSDNGGAAKLRTLGIDDALIAQRLLGLPRS